jgi:hypothetical protein
LINQRRWREKHWREFEIVQKPDQKGRARRNTLKNFALTSVLICLTTVVAFSQQPEPRVALSEPATAADSHGTPAIEARLLTQVLNGADDSPVTNVKLVVRNLSGTFYTYISGWATFYDSAGVRCGEGLFKLDALAVDETAGTDTPGLRLRCSPATWRIVATNLLTRTGDIAKPGESAPPSEAERPAPMNFVISIDGEEHPIQVNNPLVLTLGNRNRTIVLKPIR